MKSSIFILSIIAVVAFNSSCTKTKTDIIIKTDTVYVPTDSAKLITANAFPVNVSFSQNEIIAAPNAVDTVNLILNFTNSVPGINCSVVTYINAGASINLSYPSNTDVALTSGSLINPAQGNNLIQFNFLGNINGINMVSVSVVLQP